MGDTLKAGACPLASASTASTAQLDVFRALLRWRATPLRATAVGPDGAWLVQWRNADTDTAYEQPTHHTLPLYLEGGEAVRCLDKPAARGAPGSLCCLPAGSAAVCHQQARRRVLECIEAAHVVGSAVDLHALAGAACLSPYHFARMFKASFGMSPHAWVMQRRHTHARRLLSGARLSLPKVAADAGYAHSSHLNLALRRAAPDWAVPRATGTRPRSRSSLSLRSPRAERQTAPTAASVLCQRREASLRCSTDVRREPIRLVPPS